MKRSVFKIRFWLAVVVAVSAVLGLGAAQADAVVVNAAPTWPIPSDASVGPPPIPALSAATDQAPPADQIADPVTPNASCGSWYLQSSYGDRWSAGSTWWEYRCTSEVAQVYSHCSVGGAGACDTGWYGYPFDYATTEDRTDLFLWNGSNAVFYGEAYSYSIDDYVGYQSASLNWWDGPTVQWYLIDAYPLTVSKEGTGSGVVNSSPTGISCGADCQEFLNRGTSVSLTASADASSVFTGWSGDCSGTGACQVTMDQARSVSATFEPKRFTLTVGTAGTGSGLVVMSSGTSATGCRACTQSFEVGTSVTLTANPDASSIFTGWSGDCSGSGACEVTTDQARSVTATFALKTFAVSLLRQGAGSGQVSSSPAGISCGDSCQASFDAGTTVTLTATPAAGSIFSGWSGDCSGTGACQLSTDQARSVTATFALNTPPNAVFTLACMGLGCSFDASGSADADGAIASYAWSFGDGASASGKTVSHTYARAGSYTVSLTVTDNAAATDSASKAVNPISLNARGYKQNGLRKVDVAWNGPSGASFDVYRDGARIATVQTTAYTDNVNNKGSGSYSYRVCAVAAPVCSNETTVTF
jgi:PKD domain/Divergent InlB B-repeat domain